MTTASQYNPSTGCASYTESTGSQQSFLLPCSGVNTLELRLLGLTTTCSAYEIRTVAVGPWPINGQFYLDKFFDHGVNQGYDETVDLTGLGCYIEQYAVSCAGPVIVRKIATSLRRYVLYLPPQNNVYVSVTASWYDEADPGITGTSTMATCYVGHTSNDDCFQTIAVVPVEVNAFYTGGTCTVRQPS